MTTPPKLARPKPPEGMVWIYDYVNEDGQVEVPGIASRLCITPGTYRKWRMAGKGPQTFMFGKRVAAKITVIDQWIESLGAASAPFAA